MKNSLRILTVLAFACHLTFDVAGVVWNPPIPTETADRSVTNGFAGKNTDAYFYTNGMSDHDFFNDRMISKFIDIGNGKVLINTETGKVTYTGTPDQAARLFWDAVVLAFPHIRENIRNGTNGVDSARSVKP